MNTFASRTMNATKGIVIVLATLSIWPVSASAQLKVIISGGFAGAYEQLLPDFERTSGIKVTTGSGSSQGTGPQTIGAQLAHGVAADVVILSREGLNELIAANRIAAGTDVDLGRVSLGVAVRAMAPKPDVSTVEAFKKVLLKAKAVAVPICLLRCTECAYGTFETCRPGLKMSVYRGRPEVTGRRSKRR
jgi:molybdate transport system substrate-binding protein